MTYKNFPTKTKMGNNRNIWLFGKSGSLITKDKDLLIDSHIRYMLNKTLSMFEYKNLPDTIPQRELELIIQICRFGIVTKKDGNLFVFYGGLGGEPNEYYQPTQAIVSNPYLRFSDVLSLDDYIKKDKSIDAVVIWNDDAHIGLYPMFRKYAELLAESEITMRYLLINKRFMNILTGNDDNDKESLQKMFADVEDGKGFGIVITKNLLDTSSMGTIDTGNTKMGNDLKDVIESYQYLKGSWYNDLGLNANYNMKRESINESESDMNEDALLPMIDNMLKSRKIAIEKINQLYGSDIQVELSSSWKKIRDEIIQREEIVDAEIEQIEEQAEQESTNSEQGEENGKIES